jgi:hypothetical protein
VDDGLDARYVRTLLAWDRASAADIVDFDVTGAAATEEFATEGDALPALEALRAECAPGSFLERRLRGHTAYLRARLGEPASDFAAYIDATQAVPTAPIPEAVIDGRRALAEHSLRRAGTSFGPRVEYELEALDGVVSIDSLPAAFRDADAALRPELEQALGHPLELEYDTGFIDDDGWWTYWADTAGGRFRLRFNRRGKASLTDAEVRQFTAHEVLGHFGQVHAYAQRIAAGELPLSAGITTVHTLEQFAFEGVAQTLPLWLRPPEEIDRLLLARIRLTHLCALVEHNAHLMVNSGESPERTAQYMLERLPHYQPERVRADLAARADDPLDRSYRFVYPAAIDTMVSATERLGSGRRRDMLRRLYAGPISHADFVAAAA